MVTNLTKVLKVVTFVLVETVKWPKLINYVAKLKHDLAIYDNIVISSYIYIIYAIVFSYVAMSVNRCSCHHALSK